MATIVCAVDDSTEAAHALHEAARLAHTAGLRLVVVNVRRSAPGRANQLVERLVSEQCGARAVETRVEVGERASTVARVASEEAASCIVLGAHRPRRWLPRNRDPLANDLASIASCPVVVVPPAARR